MGDLLSFKIFVQTNYAVGNITFFADNHLFGYLPHCRMTEYALQNFDGILTVFGVFDRFHPQNHAKSRFFCGIYVNNVVGNKDYADDSKKTKAYVGKKLEHCNAFLNILFSTLYDKTLSRVHYITYKSKCKDFFIALSDLSLCTVLLTKVQKIGTI